MPVRKRALVIEDSASLLRPLCRMVEEQGFEAIPAMSLAEVRQALEEYPVFSVAVADYCLPDATHGETLPVLFARQIPTIVLTALNDRQTREDILKMPVVDYIPKDSPASLDYLARLLKRVDRNPEIKVLVVDDSHAAQQLLCDYLERHLYTTVTASSAEEALQILRRDGDIRLVLADYGMPGMDGMQLTSAIRRLTGHNRLAIVGISVQEDPTMTARFLKAGADDYLQKPFSFEEFICRITRNVEFIENLMTLEHIAHADPLTGLSNRRHFFEEVQHMRGALGIGILDIDHFKVINDTFGHDVGDGVICHVADTLRRYFPHALVARFGGEEFVVVMRRDTAHPLAQRLEELRQDIAGQTLFHDKGDLRYTVSVGMAAGVDKDVRELLKLADERLYKAKQTGRNRVCAA
ncbi:MULTISPECIES: diguanylate cyclase [Gulbenkiania]|uniref:diguanylate cyclase n=1 Tax=Gulbenkiania indica TaxID=375574 RepID=A0A0K6H4V2_9NEIS|nr:MULTISPECIES: diguanylate cyclase [Gulbenkiania]CUA86018.1 diguanylate cyclase (GGDEF) domain [Gulbenkiania indica]